MFSNYDLVLDLDETLIHSSEKPVKINFCFINIFYKKIKGNHASFKFALERVNWQGGVEKIEYWVYERPGLKEFLQKMSQMFELVAWTAGAQDYGTKILSHIDPNGEYFVHSLFQHCTPIYHNIALTKDLSKLGREMSRIMILDNAYYSYSLNSKNGIPILDFLGNPKEAELMEYIDILTKYSSPDLDITIAIPIFQEEFDEKKKMDEGKISRMIWPR